MGRTIGKAIWICVALAMLNACSATHYTSFRQRPVYKDTASAMLVDAKQRAILVGKENVKGFQAFCAEPSPDVFSVVAQALSASGSFGKSADPSTMQAALSAAFSSSEQGSTIPRTQTINMLRELMYRTCERYLGGSINSLEMPLQAIRDQRLMVSILAIEQLTGAVTPKPVVIGAQGAASAGSSASDAIVAVADARKELQAKTAAAKARKAEFDGINGEAGDCDAIADAAAKNATDTLTDELKAKSVECESAAGALLAASKEQESAADYYATVAKMSASAGPPASATASLMNPVATGGIDQAQLQSQSIDDVATVVGEIVKQNFNQDEFLFFCLKVLGNDEDAREQVSALVLADNGPRKSCIEYIKKNIQYQTELVGALIEEAKVQRTDKVGTLFDDFWKRVSVDGRRADASKVASYRKQKSWWPACFTAAGNKAEYAECFDTALVASRQRDLALGR